MKEKRNTVIWLMVIVAAVVASLTTVMLLMMRAKRRKKRLCSQSTDENACVSFDFDEAAEPSAAPEEDDQAEESKLE